MTWGELVDAIKGFGGFTTTATLWIFLGLGLWKGLPGVLVAVDKIVEAITNRQSAVEKRFRDELNEAIARFKAQISEADARLETANRRHDECMAGQDRMMDRLGVLEKLLADAQKAVFNANQKIADQQLLIQGMQRNFNQVASSTLGALPGTSAHILDLDDRRTAAAHTLSAPPEDEEDQE